MREQDRLGAAGMCCQELLFRVMKESPLEWWWPHSL